MVRDVPLLGEMEPRVELKPTTVLATGVTPSISSKRTVTIRGDSEENCTVELPFMSSRVSISRRYGGGASTLVMLSLSVLKETNSLHLVILKE